MPYYRYTALDRENRKTTGVIEARDEAGFRKIMRGMDLVPLKFKALGEKANRYRINANEVAEFCRQLANMLSSGIMAVRAMEILKERDLKSKLKNIYGQLYKDIQQGTTISDAMRRQGKAFPILLINMFASGEASGRLDHVAERMALHYEKEYKLNGKIKNAMLYPKILSAATVVVVLIIFVFVLPEFFDMLEGLGAGLPAITRGVIGISDFLVTQWYVLLIALLAVIAILRYLLSLYGIRLMLDKAKLRLPVVGKLLKIIYTARFARTLSSLYSSGVSMIHALEITGTVVMNTYIENQFTGLIRDVLNGEPLSGSIRKISGFDSKLPNTILVGEEAGRLDAMLLSTAESFDYEAEQAVNALVALAEPVMIVTMALVIMAVLLSVMQPMASLYESFGNM